MRLSNDVVKASIRLFREIPVLSERSKKKITKKQETELLKETVSFGFLFSKELLSKIDIDYAQDLVYIVAAVLGLTAEQMNQTFHKSWDKLANAPMIQLVMEQVLHYITTYGYEALGVYDRSTVFVPYEKLDLPECKEKELKLIMIRGTNAKGLKENLLQLLSSGIALKQETLKDCVCIAEAVNIELNDLQTIKNKEARCLLYGSLGMVPSEPEEFLRLIVYNLTSSTLIIKSRHAIESIKEGCSNNRFIYTSFSQYIVNNGAKGLASIFYRYKPLFLALKHAPSMPKIINGIRRLAPKYHRPLRADLLNSLTASLKAGESIHPTNLKFALDKVNIFRKIRIANALRYRMNNPESALYRIRNGKAYAKEFNGPWTNDEQVQEIYEEVMQSIAGDIYFNVAGMRIYIPEWINYTLPATEKQFTGNFPSGTSVVVNKDMIFGIHWKNVQGERIDLDLSLLDASGVKYGWDGRYRGDDRSILFSGDVTDAPGKGAAEMFYVSWNPNYAANLLLVNYYNYMESVPVPIKIMVGKKDKTRFGHNYMLTGEETVCISETVIDRHQKLLGLLITNPSQCQFYFAEGDIGNKITSSGEEWVQHARRYLVESCITKQDLCETLEAAGALITKNPEEEVDLDLSPEKIRKQTFIDLLISND